MRKATETPFNMIPGIASLEAPGAMKARESAPRPRLHICASRCDALDKSAFPGDSSTLRSFTTPSSTSIE